MITTIRYGKMVSPKQFERNVANHLRELGYTVVRADYKNGMPDFIAFANGEAAGIECKRYASCTSKRQALKAWKRKQKTQVKAFKKLRVDLPITLYILLKDGAIETEKLTLLKGRHESIG